jgi:hypothetical protein
MKTQKRKLNVKLLRRIQKHILEEPKRFWMGWWETSSIPDVNPAPCGTTACIAGWALALSGERIADYNPGVRAARILGLSADGYNKLFFSYAWPEPFLSRYERAEDNRNAKAMAKAGADRIEHFIKTGE